MSEEILRILLNDLATIRIKIQDDGVVRELPIAGLEEFAQKLHNKKEIVQATRESLTQLWEAFSHLKEEASGVEVEFVIPVKK